MTTKDRPLYAYRLIVEYPEGVDYMNPPHLWERDPDPEAPGFQWPPASSGPRPVATCRTPAPRSGPTCCAATAVWWVSADDLFKAEVVPEAHVDSLGRGRGKADAQPFVLWYAPDSDLRPDMERLCARVLAGEGRPVRIKQPVAFLFDGDGAFKGWAK